MKHQTDFDEIIKSESIKSLSSSADKLLEFFWLKMAATANQTQQKQK